MGAAVPVKRLKSGRGGARKGAGRKKHGEHVDITVRISPPAKAWLDAQEQSQSAVVEGLIIEKMPKLPADP